MDQTTPLPDLPGGPYDVEFFFDPECPFAWQTSVWMRRVAELRGLAIGWRFVSLRFLNEDHAVPPQYLEIQQRGLRFHRITAAARERFGNDAVGRLYRGYGERYWYQEGGHEPVDPVELVRSLGFPADLADAADDERYDEVVRAETDEALRRAGPDVGTPVITYDPPAGNSLFGPVISSVPDDARSLDLYDALRTLATFDAFSELKRSNRPPLDLPLLAA